MSYLTRFLTLNALFLIPLLASAQTAEGVPTLALDCQAPGKTDIPNRDPAAPWFLLQASEAPLFECRMDNLGTTNREVLLLGEVQREGTLPTAMGETVTLSPGPPERRRLTFPVPNVPGEYTYQFTLRDKATGEVLVGPIKQWGRLEGTLTATLLSVTPEGSTATWGTTIPLQVLIATPEATAVETLGLSLTARLFDVNGGSCATLLERQPVTQNQAEYSITLPAQGPCTNTLEVSLHNSTGERQDGQQVALNLPSQEYVAQQKVPQTTPSWKAWGMVGLVVLGVGTVLIFWRHRNRGRFTQV